MAVVNLALFIISILLSSARANHNPTCNENQCTLLPIDEDVVLKFQELAAEEGVRIIYLNTEMGNDRKHPLESNERFFAERWVWANRISEPMLSLLEDKDDYIVYSFGLLKHQVRYLKVPLRDQPHGCLARLNTSCQNNVVGQTLLANFTKVSSDKRLQKAIPTDCVCALRIVDSTKLKHVCCGVENVTELNYPRVHCQLRARSAWLQILDGFKNLFTFILILYSTALPLLLPDWIINLQHEFDKDKSMQTQIRNNLVMPDQQNANELNQREDSDNIHEENFHNVGDRNLHRDTDNDSNDEHQMSANQSSDPHRGIDLKHDTDETGNERNLIFVRPINQFENNMTEDIDQHQTRSNQGSNDSVGREVSEQGTNEEDFSYVGDRNVQRDIDDDSNDEQQQRSIQVSSDHQHETNQSADLDDQTSEGDSYVGIVINPYSELLTVVKEDQETLDRKIPLDDTSPITFGALLSDYAKELPDFQINFNLKMLFLCFGVFPFFVYLKFALIIFQRMESYREFYQTYKNCSKDKLNDIILCSAIGGFSSQTVDVNWSHIFFLVECVILFIILLSIRPKDLFYSNDDLLFCFHDNSPSVSLGHEIIIHLNFLHHRAYDLTFFTLWNYISALKTGIARCALCKITLQRRIRTFRSLCYFFSSLIGLFLSAVLGTICIVFFLVSLGILILLLSPITTSYIFFTKKFMRIRAMLTLLTRVSSLVLIVISAFCFSATLVFIYFILYTSADFIIKTFLFTVMGLVLNAELITPYVAFTLVVTRNLYLCYSNLQSRYKEVKDMIANHWKKNIEEPPGQGSDNEETIPKELFWFVCGKGKSAHQKNVLPLRAEICSMLRDMVLILTFLSVSLFAILVFRSMNDISALVSTIFVFVSGVIPSLIFQGFTKREKFSGWNKTKIEKEIKEAVKEYISKQKESTLHG